MSTSSPRAHLTRILPAPAADIFAAWTDPAALAQWMTPSGTATAEVDLRVGGRFRLVMADEHLRIEHTGEYQVIHELATDSETGSHAGGWGQLLGRLQAYLEDTCWST